MLTGLLILSVLLLFNAVFAMSELAVMTSRHSRLQQAAARGHRGAAMAMKLSREPTRFLSTVQIGITLIGVLAGAFGEKSLANSLQAHLARVPWLEPYSDPLALWIVVFIITYMTVVFGELVPKRLALAHPERMASLIAPLLRWLSVVAAGPVVLLSRSTDAVLRLLRVRSRTVDDVSQEDVKAVVTRAAATGVFSPQEHDLFRRIFQLGDLQVQALMAPRVDIVWIDENMPIERVRVLVATNPYSHFPVCRGDLEQLVGVVHIKDLIAYGLLAGTDFKVAKVARRPIFIPETMPALKLLDLFQHTRTHVAFVVDEYGGLEGLLTMNDLVKALVGDIARPGDEEPPQAIQRADGAWLVDGRLPLHELIEVLGLSEAVLEDRPRVSTAAGLFTALLGRLPEEGEFVQWRDWRLEVVDMDGPRLDKLLAERIAPPQADAERGRA